MAGRTVPKFNTVFVDGYALTGYTVNLGPLSTVFDEPDLTTMGDAVKGTLPAWCDLNVGALNGVFDNTASTGLHVLHSAGAGAKHLVTAMFGDRAAPAQGGWAFTAECEQGAYTEHDSSGAAFVNLPFSKTANNATTLQYPKGWGMVLNANTARTGANSSTGVDYPSAASTAFGGYMAYHVTAGNGTATISVDDSADNSSFSALSGATTGSITCAAGVSGIVALARTATVRRYLRYQIAMGTATSVTFVLTFVRMTY